jgi:hypothetical protein
MRLDEKEGARGTNKRSKHETAAEEKIRTMEGENKGEIVNSAQYKEELEKFKKDRLRVK